MAIPNQVEENIKNVDCIINLCGILFENKSGDFFRVHTDVPAFLGKISLKHKINSLAEKYGVPVIPHAGQMHNYHLTMASNNCPFSEFFPVHQVEIGNELFYYLFKGEPEPKNGFIDLNDDIPGLGISINEKYKSDFEIIN